MSDAQLDMLDELVPDVAKGKRKVGYLNLSTGFCDSAALRAE
jgi:hypothetical protein